MQRNWRPLLQVLYVQSMPDINKERITSEVWGQEWEVVFENSPHFCFNGANTNDLAGGGGGGGGMRWAKGPCVRLMPDGLVEWLV